MLEEERERIVRPVGEGTRRVGGGRSGCEWYEIAAVRCSRGSFWD